MMAKVIKDKLWADCSKEEKREVRNLENRLKRTFRAYNTNKEALTSLFINGDISIKDYIDDLIIAIEKKDKKIELLKQELDAIERKYDE